jgi:hypothetical protein
MPALANVALTDTFDTWRIRTNQLIVKTNDSESVITGSFDKANSANYFAYLVNANTISAFDKANTANILASGAYDKANTANILASGAFDKANSANYFAYLVNANTNSAFDKANTGSIIASNAFDKANSANYFSFLINSNTNSAFAKANAALANTSGVSFNGSLYFPSGSIGIGTTSPSANLDVSGSVSVAKANVLSQTLTDQATIAWDTSLGQIATITLGGNRSIAAPTNLKVGTYILHVIQDSGGSRTLTWNGVFKWPAGVAPVLTTTGNARDVMSFVSDGTNLYGSFLPDVK